MRRDPGDGTAALNTDQIKLFLGALGAKEFKVNDEWVNCSCPLAPFFHKKGGVDSRPSFGIKIEPSKHSNFHCWVCESGSLEDLIGALEFRLKQHPELAGRYDLNAARLYLDGEELVVQKLPEYSEHTPSPASAFEEWPQWFMDQYPLVDKVPRAREYLLTGRNGSGQPLPASQWLTNSLRWDPTREMIIAPYRNVWGKLAGARGRCINPERFLQHYDYTWNEVNNADLVWYGEECFQLDLPILVVEGQFDAMHLRQVYPATIAGLSAKVTPYKLHRLTSFAQVAFMLDHDEAGENATAKYVEYLQAAGVEVGIVEYPDQYKDPAKIPLPEIKDILAFLTNP